MIYPMKALAFDQLNQIQNFCDSLGIESFRKNGDKDTPRSILKIARCNNRQSDASHFDDKPRKFEHVVSGMEGQHWVEFSAPGLKYIVIDEMHMYRGYFGCNMALLLRRFFCSSETSWGFLLACFLSTATCENPQEHAENLLGRKVEMVTARDCVSSDSVILSL